MDKLNIALIGAGSISGSHGQAYERNPHAVLAAVCDLNEERARQAAKRYGCRKVTTDYREIMADSDIDAVSVCTWNNAHAEISIAALQAGKHVLVEKPLCMSVEEALRVREAARASDRVLQVGFVRRYDPNAQMLKRFADAGEFGDIYYAKASSIRRLGNPGGWFSDIARSGGGPLIDIGVHVIDLSWYMMGKPKPVSVSANVYRKLGNRSNVRGLTFYRAADYNADLNTVEDMANALIRFENGASLMVDVSFTLHAKQDRTSVSLYGEKGGFELDPELQIITEKHDTILNISPQTDHKGFHFEAAFQNEIDCFISCILTGQEPVSPVEDGVEVMKMLCGIYESAAQGCEIRL
ncbi:MAG: oxidoreductase [Paenibacillaceae bacterium]|nr:oxidoreductase [Paenibacillaceae bacterium]